MIIQTRSLDQGILSFFDIGLFMIIVFLAFLFMFITMYKITVDIGAASELQKRNGFTWAIAFMFLGISNILNVLWRYAISEQFFIVATETIAVFCVNCALLLKIIHTEYQLKSYQMTKRYYFSFVALGLTLFTTIFTPELIRNNEGFAIVYLILLTAGASIFPIIFLYLAIKLEGSERKMAVKILIGTFLLLLGLLFQPHNVGPYLTIMGLPVDQWVLDVLLISSPVVMSIGMLIIYMSYTKSL